MPSHHPTRVGSPTDSISFVRSAGDPSIADGSTVKVGGEIQRIVGIGGEFAVARIAAEVGDDTLHTGFLEFSSSCRFEKRAGAHTSLSLARARAMGSPTCPVAPVMTTVEASIIHSSCNTPTDFSACLFGFGSSDIPASRTYAS